MRNFVVLKIKILVFILFSPMSLFAQTISEGVPMGDVQCGCPGGMKYQGSAATCEEACFGTSKQAPAIDYEAQRREQDAIAERQRHQVEAERKERERQAELKQKRDAEFIRDRDASVSKLKGSSADTKPQLKGLLNTDNFGLKGSNYNTNSKLKAATPNSPSLDKSAAITKTLKALNCALQSIVEEFKTAKGSNSDEAINLDADLADIKKRLEIAPSGSKDTIQVNSISLSHLSQNKNKESQFVGSIIINRHEDTGEVHIIVEDESTQTANILFRLFGKKVSRKKTHNIMILDRTGNILDKEITNAVKKCTISK